MILENVDVEQHCPISSYILHSEKRFDWMNEINLFGSLFLFK